MGLLARYANGVPIKALAAIFQHDALVLISKADSGIVSPYEMAGKRIMFDATTGNDVLLNALLADANLSLKDLKITPQNLGIQSLIDGRVDLTIVAAGELTPTVLIGLAGLLVMIFMEISYSPAKRN